MTRSAGFSFIFPFILLAMSAQVQGDSIDSEDSPTHRLSGIVTVNDERRIALLELPDGEFFVLREGDAFEGGTVVQIAAQWLLIRYPGKEERLWLDSAEFSASGSGSDSPLVLEKIDEGITLTRSLDQAAVIPELDSVAIPKDSGPDLSGLLQPLIDIPAGAQVVAIDHHPLGSVEDSLTYIREALALGNTVRLSLDGVPGKESVYLMPVQQ